MPSGRAEKRADPNEVGTANAGKKYTRQAFVDFYGKKLGMKFWDAAATKDSGVKGKATGTRRFLTVLRNLDDCMDKRDSQLILDLDLDVRPQANAALIAAAAAKLREPLTRARLSSGPIPLKRPAPGEGSDPGVTSASIYVNNPDPSLWGAAAELLDALPHSCVSIDCDRWSGIDEPDVVAAAVTAVVALRERRALRGEPAPTVLRLDCEDSLWGPARQAAVLGALRGREGRRGLTVRANGWPSASLPGALDGTVFDAHGVADHFTLYSPLDPAPLLPGRRVVVAAESAPRVPGGAAELRGCAALCIDARRLFSSELAQIGEVAPAVRQSVLDAIAGSDAPRVEITCLHKPGHKPRAMDCVPSELVDTVFRSRSGSGPRTILLEPGTTALVCSLADALQGCDARGAGGWRLVVRRCCVDACGDIAELIDAAASVPGLSQLFVIVQTPAEDLSGRARAISRLGGLDALVLMSKGRSCNTYREAHVVRAGAGGAPAVRRVRDRVSLTALRRGLDADLLSGQRDRERREKEAVALIYARHRAGATSPLGAAYWGHVASSHGVLGFMLTGMSAHEQEG